MNHRFLYSLLSLLLATGVANAGSGTVNWHQYELLNKAIETPWKPRTPTNVNYRSEVFIDGFPHALYEREGVKMSAQADLKADNDTLLLKAATRMHWETYEESGNLWANANAYMTASFDLPAASQTVVPVSREIVVTMEGDYVEYSIELIADDSKKTPLEKGRNAVNLIPGKRYVINAHLYNTMRNKAAAAGDQESNANMRITLGP